MTTTTATAASTIRQYALSLRANESVAESLFHGSQNGTLTPAQADRFLKALTNLADLADLLDAADPGIVAAYDREAFRWADGLSGYVAHKHGFDL